ncbi:MarR family winged helix-turn-helix transcriptional regulator [Nocardia paucivorans]|uniref:MarR family winged helix-turn-helix transcriptional regulator n=1 Tax=Nocardia paucivorans TaxID=114259 RepID=UPI001FE195C8|nr:MarR family winged helix-turn-helix transcriptional regulator [Nocardia paucivorans]
MSPMRAHGGRERHIGLDAKIVAALDRFGEALQVLARRKAEAYELSPTQMRVLTKLYTGTPPAARNSELARELDITEPTMSDTVAALIRKGLLDRRRDPHDRRRQLLALTRAGRDTAAAVARWTAPAEIALSHLDQATGEQLLDSLLAVLAEFHHAGLNTVSRACTTCRHLQRVAEPDGRGYRCGHYDTALTRSELRVDCAEHVHLDTAS